MTTKEIENLSNENLLNEYGGRLIATNGEMLNCSNVEVHVELTNMHKEILKRMGAE